MTDDTKRHLMIVDGNYQGVLSVPAAARLGCRVTFVTSSRMRPFYDRPDLADILDAADAVVDVPDGTDSACVEEVIREAQARGRIDGLLTTHDFCVGPLAAAAERTGVRFSSRRAVDSARDKGLCRQILRDSGLRSTAFAVVDEGEDLARAGAAVGYPLVVKPVSGVGGLLVSLIRSGSEMDDYVSAVSDRRERLRSHQSAGVDPRFIVEAFVPGPILQVEMAVSGGEATPLMISSGKRSARNPILSIGTDMPASLSGDVEATVVEYCRSVLSALGFDLGLVHIELAMTPSGPCLIEVNPRLMGSSLPRLFSHVTGVDIFEILVRVHCGEPVGAARSERKRTASSRPIASWQGARVRDDLPADWIEPFRERLVDHEIRAQAGQRVSPLRSMYDFIGYLQVCSDEHDDVPRRADALAREVGRSLGFEAAL